MSFRQNCYFRTYMYACFPEDCVKSSSLKDERRQIDPTVKK